MVFAAIVAGGVGSRIKGADKPKQFLEINGIPIIIRTINTFLSCEQIDRVYVGINPNRKEYFLKLLEEFFTDSKKVITVNGGIDRDSTIMNIVNNIINDNTCKKEDILVTHDAVRPFVSEKIILENIENAKKYGVCGTYIPCIDTIIKSEDGEFAKENLVRNQLFNAQTPQSFNISKFLDCRKKLGEEKISTLTDTCGIFSACAIPVKIVWGEQSNFKITNNFDLQLAEFVASYRQNRL